MALQRSGRGAGEGRHREDLGAVRLLDRSEWLAAWLELPPEQREAYWHPDFVATAARWENACPCCVRIDCASGWMLYPFLRHPITGYDYIPDNCADIQSAYGYGGPIFVGTVEPSVQLGLLALLRDWLLENDVVAEFVRCHGEWIDVSTLQEAGYRITDVRVNVECDLSQGPDAVCKGWAAVAQRNIRIACKAGVQSRIATTISDWDEFSRLYELTANRLMMAPGYRFDRSYFHGLASLPSDCGALILVETSSSTPIAGAVVFFGGRLAHYHLGASDLGFRELRPNDYLYRSMADFSSRRGCSRIVWGGGRSSKPSDSLFRFKSHFGSIRRPAKIAGRVINRRVFDCLCEQWSNRHPEISTNDNFFLQYRA